MASFYEYLTDEKKDVEQGNQENTGGGNVRRYHRTLRKIVFDHVIKHRKDPFTTLRTIKQGQDYPFSRKLDDRLHGKGIRASYPCHRAHSMMYAENEQMLRTSSTYKS